MELKEIINAGAKFLWENWCSPNEQEQKLKTWMGNSTGNTDKKSMKTSKNDKTEVERRNMTEKRGKSN